jgi:hypothetical protein
LVAPDVFQNAVLKHVTEGKIDGKGRRRRRSKLLLYDLKDKRKCCKWNEAALDGSPWRTRCRLGYNEPGARQNT